VKATNGAGISQPSNDSTFVVPGACMTAPGAPRGLFVMSNSGGLVTLAWLEPEGSPTTYLLESGSAPGLTDLGTLDLRSTSPTLTGSAPPGTYFVRVRARNVCGISPPSNEVVLTVG